MPQTPQQSRFWLAGPLGFLIAASFILAAMMPPADAGLSHRSGLFAGAEEGKGERAAAARLALEQAVPQVLVDALYRSVLRRPPQPLEVSGFVARRQHGETAARLIKDFMQSAQVVEYGRRIGCLRAFGEPKDEDFLRGMYRKVLLRDPSQTEVQAGLRSLASGKSRVGLLREFLGSEEVVDWLVAEQLLDRLGKGAGMGWSPAEQVERQLGRPDTRLANRPPSRRLNREPYFEDDFNGSHLKPGWVVRGDGAHRVSGGTLLFTTQTGDLGRYGIEPHHLFLIKPPEGCTQWTADARVKFKPDEYYEQVAVVAYKDNANCLKVCYNYGGYKEGSGTLWAFYKFHEGKGTPGGYEVPRHDDYIWLRMVRDGNHYRAYASYDAATDPDAVNFSLVDVHAVELDGLMVGIGGWNSGMGPSGELAQFDYFRLMGGDARFV